MSIPTVLEWTDENKYRAYPLTSNSPQFIIINGTQIDCYCLFRDANFIYTSTMPVNIDITVEKTGDDLIFVATGLARFYITNPQSSDSYPLYIMSDDNRSTLILGEEVLNLKTALTDSVLVDFNVTFEPCTAIQLTGQMAGVSSISFNGTVISSGDITLIEGYQTDIQFNDQTIEVTVGRNSGIPLGCSPFFSGIVPNDCGSIISFINGASPRTSGTTITLKAGDNVQIFEDPEKSRLYIGLNFDSGDVCQPTTLPPAPNI